MHLCWRLFTDLSGERVEIPSNLTAGPPPSDYNFFFAELHSWVQLCTSSRLNGHLPFLLYIIRLIYHLSSVECLVGIVVKDQSGYESETVIVKYVNTMDSETFGKRNEGDYEQDMKTSLSKRTNMSLHVVQGWYIELQELRWMWNDIMSYLICTYIQPLRSYLPFVRSSNYVTQEQVHTCTL